MKARAFTLVELLAAMGAVVLLAGLVFSGIAAARTQARSAECVSNLRQWGTALQLYVQDHDGYLPRRGQGVQPVFRIDRSQDWFNALCPYLDLPPYHEMVRRGEAPRPGDRSVFVCPEAVAPDGNTHFICYGMNMYLSRWDQPQPLRITRLSGLSEIAFLADSPGGYASTVPSARPYSVVARHGGRANVAFLDGHVKSLSGDYLGCGTGEKSQPDVRWKTGLSDTWTPN